MQGRHVQADAGCDAQRKYSQKYMVSDVAALGLAGLAHIITTTIDLGPENRSSFHNHSQCNTTHLGSLRPCGLGHWYSSVCVLYLVKRMCLLLQQA